MGHRSCRIHCILTNCTLTRQGKLLSQGQHLLGFEAPLAQPAGACPASLCTPVLCFLLLPALSPAQYPHTSTSPFHRAFPRALVPKHSQLPGLTLTTARLPNATRLPAFCPVPCQMLKAAKTAWVSAARSQPCRVLVQACTSCTSMKSPLQGPTAPSTSPLAPQICPVHPNLPHVPNLPQAPQSALRTPALHGCPFPSASPAGLCPPLQPPG